MGAAAAPASPAHPAHQAAGPPAATPSHVSPAALDTPAPRLPPVQRSATPSTPALLAPSTRPIMARLCPLSSVSASQVCVTLPHKATAAGPLRRARPGLSIDLSASTSGCDNTSCTPAALPLNKALPPLLPAAPVLVAAAGFGSSSGKGVCTLCPAGTFSDGGSMEDCKPCPFGFTSAPGACGIHECRPVVHACPIGQWAPMGSTSPADCRCYRGFGGGLPAACAFGGTAVTHSVGLRSSLKPHTV